MDTKHIPAKLYRRIQRLLPVFCVDVILKMKSGGVLVGIRKNHPVKDYIYPIGGRVYYGERIEHAVARKVREEAGLAVKPVKMIGVYTTFFTKGERRHNISVAYLAKEVSGKAHVPKGSDLTGLLHIKRIEKRFHPYLRQLLSDSNVFGKRIKGRRTFFIN